MAEDKVIERTGDYGKYYGSPKGKSKSLNENQSQTNAIYIYSYLLDHPPAEGKQWAVESIMALLGNMSSESALNPGRWQSEDVDNMEMGYGLVQWTPASKYIDAPNTRDNISDYSTMDANLARINYEIKNGLQWIEKESADNISFLDFATNKEKMTVAKLTAAFMVCYERPKDQSADAQKKRGEKGEAWVKYFEDNNIAAIPKQGLPGIYINTSKLSGTIETVQATPLIWKQGDFQSLNTQIYIGGEWVSVTSPGSPTSEDYPEDLPADKFAWPVPDRKILDYRFGDSPKYGRYHNGIDIACKKGTSVYAVEAGTVYNIYNTATEGRNADDGNGFGNNVRIDHGNINGHNIRTIYAHLDVGQVFVKLNDTIKKGQLIGKSGNTGSVGGKTGEHLHLGLYVDGQGGSNAKDPIPYLDTEDVKDKSGD